MTETGPYWALITVFPIPNSENKSAESRNQLLAPNYRYPKLNEVMALFVGASLEGSDVLPTSLSSRIQEDPHFTVFNSESEIVEVDYLEYNSGTLAVRTK